MELDTVGKLIDYLGKFDRNKEIAIDNDGSHYYLDTESVKLWDAENPDDSPVAIYV